MSILPLSFFGCQERIQLETARLYKQAGVNPLAGERFTVVCFERSYRCPALLSLMAFVLNTAVVDICAIQIAGCLPTLATLPVWIGLYRALSNVANEVVALGYDP